MSSNRRAKKSSGITISNPFSGMSNPFSGMSMPSFSKAAPAEKSLAKKG